MSLKILLQYNIMEIYVYKTPPKYVVLKKSLKNKSFYNGLK
jgi:hypothetical protein